MQTPVIAITARRWDARPADKNRLRLPGTGVVVK